MNFEELLNKLKEKQIEIGLVEGKLKVLDTQGNLDNVLIAALKERKASLMEWLAPNESLTPSDFPYAHLTDQSLTQISQSLGDINDIYMATPMQAGMLFHGFEDAGASYTNINYYHLRGELNIACFDQAWQQIVQDCDAFRTQFFYTDDGLYHQVIAKEAKVDIQVLDWRTKAPEQLESELEDYMHAERQKGFDFSCAPLMRISLVQTQDDEYLFIWAQHHAISDGWSRPIVFAEFLKHYQALRQGESVSSTKLGDYKHYIAWLHAQDDKAAKQYWKDYLAGFAQSNPLNIDTLPVSKNANGHGSENIQLNASLTESLRRLSQSASCSMNTLFQAAWGILLSRYSNEQDIVFGSTVSGRPVAVEGVEKIIGMFLNTIPVRVKLTNESTIQEVISQVHEAFFSSDKHSYLGLSDVQRCADISAGEGLFDSLVVYQNFPEALNDISDVDAVGFSVEKASAAEHTKFGILFNIFDTEKLGVRATYSKARFQSHTVRRLLSHMEDILGAFVELGVSSAVHKIRLGNSRVATIASEPVQVKSQAQGMRLNEMFEQQVEKSPDNTAVIFSGQELTYQEFNEKSNQLAHCLIEKGVKPNTVIGIALERSLDMMIALMAVMKAGGTYVPLDNRLPPARISYIANESEMKFILSHEENANQLTNLEPEVIYLDDDTIVEQLAQQENSSVENPQGVGATPEDLLYIIFTSGSTGLPKGVLVEHQSVCNYLIQARKYFSNDDIQGSLVSSPLIFDGTVTQLYGPLINGKYVELMGSDDTDLELLADYVFDDEESLVFKMTPSHLDALRHFNSDASLDPNCDVKHVIVLGGEKLPNHLAIEWAHSILPGAQFFNEYGPTETSVAATLFEFNAEYDAELQRASTPIGKALDTYSVYVLDENLNEQPIGVPGELYIGGLGVARGYLNRPELTEEKFLNLTFDGQSVERVYKTGDRVRWLEDGNLEFLNRVDFQVKMRGLRIELGEIEQQILQHDSVAQCVVLLDDKSESERLVAFVVLGSDANSDANTDVEEQQQEQVWTQVQEMLARSLPSYMIPTEHVVLSDLPLSNNGKVDRKQLLSLIGDAVAAEFIAPETELEIGIANIWQSVLDKPQVSVTDDFFRMGGHSLLVMKVLSEIKHQLGHVVTVNTFFQYPTVRGLANYLGLNNLDEELEHMDESLVEEGEL